MVIAMTKTTSHDKRYDLALEKARLANADLGEVANMLTEAHEAGDARATYALATWHLHGKFFKKNLRVALRLLRQAAGAGVPEALYHLAVCYEEGSGVATNRSKATELFLRAALAGETQSLYEVGRRYYHGLGVQQDRRIAWVWLDHAKQMGVTEPEADADSE